MFGRFIQKFLRLSRIRHRHYSPQTRQGNLTQFRIFMLIHELSRREKKRTNETKLSFCGGSFFLFQGVSNIPNFCDNNVNPHTNTHDKEINKMLNQAGFTVSPRMVTKVQLGQNSYSPLTSQPPLMCHSFGGGNGTFQSPQAFESPLMFPSILGGNGNGTYLGWCKIWNWNGDSAKNVVRLKTIADFLHHVAQCSSKSMLVSGLQSLAKFNVDLSHKTPKVLLFQLDQI